MIIDIPLTHIYMYTDEHQPLFIDINLSPSFTLSLDKQTYLFHFIIYVDYSIRVTPVQQMTVIHIDRNLLTMHKMLQVYF